MRGVLTGCDAAQEWLLPWWWERYSATNRLPVTFFDFGMSDEARFFCKDRGEVIRIELDARFVKVRDEIEPARVAQWETFCGENLWTGRPVWFKKPLALLQSPYKYSVWIDLDCEVLSPIGELFGIGLGLARSLRSKDLPSDHPDVQYNGGVIAFERNTPLLDIWAEKALSANHLFYADDALLSALIYEHKTEITELSPLYNWCFYQGVIPHIKIVHFIGCVGKEFIRKFAGFKPALDMYA